MLFVSVFLVLVEIYNYHIFKLKRIFIFANQLLMKHKDQKQPYLNNSPYPTKGTVKCVSFNPPKLLITNYLRIYPSNFQLIF